MAPARTSIVSLPPQDPTFNGEIARTAANSTPYFPTPVSAPDGAPNILLIMTDDVGFGASSTFGGPVETPSMNSLAEVGIKYNRFHTTSLCSPTRAALLSGRNPHNAHTGIIMERSTGYPGYDTVLPRSCGTIAETLKYNGYNTAWFGKNHNVPDWQTSATGPFDLWPTGIGFEKFYGFIGGDCNQWAPNIYDGTIPIEPQLGNPDYHLDTDLADQAVSWMKEQNSLDPDKPFFLYYVPGATHAPHHVPEEFVVPYEGKFDQGWDELRKATHQRQIDLKVIPEDTELTPRPDNLGAWDDLNKDHQRVFSRMMEVYCGYLAFTDYNIGRVIDTVKETGQEENTLIIYIQGDNGGSADGSVQGTTNELAVLGNDVPESWHFIRRHMDELGGPLHYNHMPVAWSWALNSPMKWLKRFASHFGGTRNGMVMSWPKVITDTQTIRNQFHHVVDVSATILEASGVEYPVTYMNGIKQDPLDGIPMNYTWDPANADVEGRTQQIFEMYGNRGMYKDGWIACTTPVVFAWMSEPDTVDIDEFKWELYNLDNDFSQGKNLVADGLKSSPEHLAKVEELKLLWAIEAAKNNIFPLTFTSKETASGALGRPSATLGRTHFEYFSGISRVPEGAAPPLKSVSYVIKAYITINKHHGEEGVIITQGGRFGGWGLVMFNNKPTWVYKLSQQPRHRFQLDWDTKLEPGDHVIKVRFEYTGGSEIGKGGIFSLKVDNDWELKKMRLTQTIAARFSVTETMDVGFDTGTPILEDYKDQMPFAFTGDIKKITFDIDDSNLSEESVDALHASLAKFKNATD